ncbi:MAG: T9SS type A sorting domain-containing protein [Parafilimonas sp.]
MKKIFTKPIILIAICFAYTINCNAQWSTDPNVDNNLNYTTYGVGASYCSDGHGGVIYTWLDQTNNIPNVRANRIDSLGFIRWGSTGVSVNTNVGGYNYPVICEDGKGGCYIAYDITNITYQPLFCQHLDSNGNHLWKGAGTLLFSHTGMYQLNQTSPALVNDNGNGVFAVGIYGVLGGVSDVLAQRLNIHGKKMWDSGGVFVDTVWDERSPIAIADGRNGIAIIWFELTYGSTNLKMQRLNHSGVPQFTGGIKYLHGTAPFDSYAYYSIIRTTNNNYIASWIGSYSGGGNLGTPLFSQKLNASGGSLWSGNAVVVCDTASGKSFLNMISDGKDGAYYAWADGRKVNVAYGAYAQHVSAAGVLKWKRQGVQVDSIINNQSNNVSMAPDLNNGIKLFYVDEATGSNQVAMQVLNSSGVKQLPGIGTLVAAYGHPVYGNVPVSNNHAILMLSGGFAKYVPLDGVLPLTLISFNAENNGIKNIISWQTAAEINTNYFSVERSKDGINFYEIATQKSNNAPSINNYSYTDAANSDADVYYRLKMMDTDGSFTYSKIVSLPQNNNAFFKIIPNPATANCTIYFDAVAEVNSTLKIFDRNGNLQKQVLLSPKQTQLSFNVSSLSPGTYFCSIESADKIFTQKLVVIK